MSLTSCIIKTCPKCGQTKDSTEYHRRGLKLAPYCKNCVKEYNAKHYRKHRTRIIALATKWNQEHPELRREYVKRHAEKVANELD